MNVLLFLSLYLLCIIPSKIVSLDTKLSYLQNLPFNVTSMDYINTTDIEATKSFFLWHLRDNPPDTVPKDVICEKYLRCDKRKICAIICAPGTVYIEPWLKQAHQLQRVVTYQRSLCTAQLPGSHNSAITMADGYGVEDHVFQSYLKYLPRINKHDEIHTNDQLFSLTDQLNMGVRFIELDVHWFNHDLHIAHCGGFHSALLDDFINVLNAIAKLLGTDIDWDSETIGCKPSLSSIPSSEQRPLTDALHEIATWLHRPENTHEFLIIFFDDESNLEKWKKIENLVSVIQKHFHDHEIFHPYDIKDINQWPTIHEMIKMGKRVIFMTGAPFTSEGNEVLFLKRTICHWNEPSLPILPFPVCQFESIHNGPLEANGSVFRPVSSEIEYAFLNADGHRGKNMNLLTEESIPDLMTCGVNIPSPDNITPKRMESMLWAVDQSFHPILHQCIGMTRDASTWKSLDCHMKKMVAACVNPNNPLHWELSALIDFENQARKACQDKSMEYNVPANGYENMILYQLLLENHSIELHGIWINVQDIVQDIYFTNSMHQDYTSILRLNDIVAME